MDILPMYLYTTSLPSVCECQMGSVSLLELELQVVMSHHVVN